MTCTTDPLNENFVSPTAVLDRLTISVEVGVI